MGMTISDKKIDRQCYDYYKWTDREYEWTDEYCELTDEYDEWKNEYYELKEEQSTTKNEYSEREKITPSDQASNTIIQ